jgi:hypothetical protein
MRSTSEVHCAITTPQEKKLGVLENKQSNRVNLHTSISDQENSGGLRATPVLTANRDGYTTNTSSVNLNDIFPPLIRKSLSKKIENSRKRGGKSRAQEQKDAVYVFFLNDYRT